MEVFIIAAMLTIVGVYIYLSRANQIYRLDNHGRRSGFDRRKAFIGSKNQLQRSGKDRRQSPESARSPGTNQMGGESMKWNTDSIKVSVEDSGNYIQISKPGIFDSSCKISFRSEDVDILNHWLMEAKLKALELQGSAINIINEGGPA